jgi:hypothetical protein
VPDQPSVSGALTKEVTLNPLLKTRKKRKKACRIRTTISLNAPHRRVLQALDVGLLVYVDEHGSLNEVGATRLLTSILGWMKRRN